MSEMITASALKHRIILQKPVYSRDEMGGTAIFWEDAATLWAAIEPLRATEPFLFQKDQPVVTHKITCRYRADIAPHLRLRKGGRIFQIKSVRNIAEEGHTLEVMCEERI